MKKLDFITNLKGIVEDVRVDKNSILQRDTTNIIFVKSQSKDVVFKEEFIIKDIALFEKSSKNAERFEEAADRIVFTGKDTVIDFMKTEPDEAILPKESAEKINELDYKDGQKIILTDEVKKKLTEAIDTGFSNVINLYSDGENLKISIGGKEGKHKYTAVLGSCKDKFECLIGTDFLKTILGSLAGYSELFVKGGKYPIKFTDVTDNYSTEMFLAPRTEE